MAYTYGGGDNPPPTTTKCRSKYATVPVFRNKPGLREKSPGYSFNEKYIKIILSKLNFKLYWIILNYRIVEYHYSIVPNTSVYVKLQCGEITGGRRLVFSLELDRSETTTTTTITMTILPCEQNVAALNSLGFSKILWSADRFSIMLCAAVFKI